MSLNNKTLIILASLVIVWLSGSSSLFFIFLLIALLVILAPSKKHTPVPSGTPEAAAQETRYRDNLVSEIARESRPEIKAGLSRALELFDHRFALPIPPAPQNNSQTIPTSVVTSTPVETITSPIITKEEQETRNINMILYVASFLLVGAAALFIGTGLPATLKFISLCLIAGLFYGSGLLLHDRMIRLRPAALAFVGTGLALIPFAGLAYYNYVLPDGPSVWFVTSGVGLVAFLFATYRLKSQVLAYLSLAFLFSLAGSGVSVLSVAFVWYFVAIIMLGTLVALLAVYRPGWVDRSFDQPLEETAQLTVPLAVIGSLFLSNVLSTFDYELIFGVSALHYAVGSLKPIKYQLRRLNWSLARFFTVLFTLTLIYDLTADATWVGVGLIAIAVLVQVYSLARARSGNQYEVVWLWGSQAAVVLAMFIWYPEWWLVVDGLLLLALISAVHAFSLKNAAYGVTGLISLLALPMVLGRYAPVTPLPYELLATVCIVASASILAVQAAFRHRATVDFKLLFASGYGLFGLQAIAIASLSGDQLWLSAMIIAVAFVVYIASFVEREAALVGIASPVLALGVLLLLKELGADPMWLPLYTAWLLGALLYGLKWYLQGQNDNKRADILLLSSIVALLLGAFVTIYGSETLVAAVLTAIVASGLLVYEGVRRKTTSYYEIAIVIATLALQALVADVYEPDILVYTHWWAASVALMALLRLSVGQRKEAKERGIVALALMTIPTGLMALSDPDTYQLLFVLEHGALLVAGAVKNNRFVMMWAAIAIGLAVIWFLRNYSFILLALLGFGLIMLAVWRLTRHRDNQSKDV